MIPSNIQKSHLKKAIEEIRTKGVRKGRHSSTYDVFYKGNRYPPKLVVSIANRFANGKELDPASFSGGAGTECFSVLNENGFEIKAKKVKVWVEKTIVKGRKSRNSGELRLGKALWPPTKSKGGADIYSTMREIRANDIVLHFTDNFGITGVSVAASSYKDGSGVKGSVWEGPAYHVPLKGFQKLDPELERSKILNKENKPVLDVIRSRSKVFYQEDLNLRQGAYLTEAPYELVNIINKAYMATGNKTIPYLDGFNQGASFYDVLKKAEAEMNKAGFRYKSLSESRNYVWVEGPKKKIGKTPAHYEFILRKGGLLNLEVHFEEAGTKKLFGECLGALPEPLVWFDRSGTMSIRHKNVYNISETLDSEMIVADIKELDKLVGNQVRSLIGLGRVWLYSAGEDSSQWNEFYQKGIMALGYDDLGNLSQFKSKKQISEAIKRSEWYKKENPSNHALANYQFANEISLGDIIIVKDGRHSLLGYGFVTSDYFYDERRKHFKSCRSVDWKVSGLWETNYDFVIKTLTDISGYSSKTTNDKFWFQALLAIMNNKYDNGITMEKSINQILYGPPGTGKTYALRKDYFPKYTITGTPLSKEENFKDIVAECTWFEVIAIALIEEGKSKVSEILKNRWVDQKYKMSKAKSPRELIWGTLGYHALESCEFVNNSERSNVTVFFKDQFSYWELSMKDAEEKIPEIFEIIDKAENYAPKQDVERKNYSFITFHQSYSYEDFVEGIKPVMDNKSSSELTEIGYEIKDGVFKILCKKAEENRKERFAIFIDEINRGNVSAIFGELITLIEDDKRKDRENEISVTLPYSKEVFCVPANVDIYATMNTADRSVEALDTALRRRFSFKEIMPDPSVIKPVKIGGVDLSDILTAINTRLEILLDRDHTIGHSYFIGLKNQDDLKGVFKDKVVPLLQEYFYGDYGKIGLVLGEGFVRLKNKKEKPFASFNYEGKEDLNRSFYELNVIDKNFDIEKALKALLNKTVED